MHHTGSNFVNQLRTQAKDGQVQQVVLPISVEIAAEERAGLRRAATRPGAARSVAQKVEDRRVCDAVPPGGDNGNAALCGVGNEAIPEIQILGGALPDWQNREVIAVE